MSADVYPLHGVRVVDATTSIAGSLCGKLLADAGATVLKVETRTHDHTRTVPGARAVASLPHSGMSAQPLDTDWYTFLNAGKMIRSMPLEHRGGMNPAPAPPRHAQSSEELHVDSSSPGAWAPDPPVRATVHTGTRGQGAVEESLAELLAGADLFLTSWTHGEAAAYDLDCPTLLDRFPHLITACVTPFGQTGPYAHYRGDDLTLCALSGLADATPGFPDHIDHDDEPPVQSRAPLAEMAGGLIAANAVFGTLLQGLRGESPPRHIEVAALEAAICFMTWEWGFTAFGGGIRGRRSRHTELEPNCYLPCRDGHVVLVAFTEPHWRGLVDMMGNPDWAADPAYATARSRGEHWESLHAHLRQWTSRQYGRDVLTAAQQRGIPCCSSFELRDTVASEQVRHNDGLRTIVGTRGAAAFPADPIVVNGRRRTPPPTSARSDAQPEDTRGVSMNRERRDAMNPVPTGRPLSGIRVIDLGQIVAGPYTGHLLAALGAEVILVESRTHMVSRMFGPFGGTPTYDACPTFNQVNRGKQSIEIDLTTETGREILLKLVATADVVLENYSRRAADRLGVTYENLARVRPDIILASISGFGRRGPWGDFVALHSGVILLSGLASVTRDTCGRMRLAGAIYPDFLAGAYTALAIQQALAQRAQAGTGCHVEVSMLDVLLTCMGGLVPAAAEGETFAPYPNSFVRTDEPDEYVAVPVAGAPCGSGGTSLRNISGLTKREAMDALQADGIAAGAVLNMDEVITDPQHLARQFVVADDHPVTGPRPMPAVPWLYDGVRPSLSHAPRFGQDTEAVMTHILGLSPAEVDRLRTEGVLR